MTPAPTAPLDRLTAARPVTAALLLGALLLLILLGVAGAGPSKAPPAPVGHADVDLYARVVEDARHPATFYARAVAEQRREGYPVRPAITVRPPTLAFFLAALPGDGARRLALQITALTVMLAWTRRLIDARLPPLVFALAVLAAASGILGGFAGRLYLSHEAWAGLLMALSLVAYRPRAWALSLALGVTAALVRELAAPYLLVMALFAGIEGRRGEAAAWLGGLGVVAAALAAHAWAVSPHILPSDPAGPGWLRLGGWSFVLATAQWSVLTVNGPGWLAAVLTPLSLLGALAWAGPTGGRLSLTAFGFTGAFLLIGRPDNDYWGLMTAPLMGLGLAMAPSALLILARRLGPAPAVRAAPLG